MTLMDSDLDRESLISRRVTSFERAHTIPGGGSNKMGYQKNRHSENKSMLSMFMSCRKSARG